MKRRQFLRHQVAVSLGFVGLSHFALGCKTDQLVDLAVGYGPLLKDPAGILDLPAGFTYKIISKMGEMMEDGFHVPGAADGMAAFSGPNGEVIIVRNHELSPDSKAGPFGAENELLEKTNPDSLYDFGYGKVPCLGGTTTLVYDQTAQAVQSQYLSLVGTIRNCAGGSTPWGTWISCEENTTIGHPEIEKAHGYNFEVPATVEGSIAPPVPLRAMGRFNHEAVCVDPRTSIVYQTEDRKDGLIYRFIPDVPGNLAEGGRLQALALVDHEGFDTRNWKTLKSEKMEVGKNYSTRWIDLDDVEAPEDDLRIRGNQDGAARFARGEGIWFGEGELYFACTNGGHLGHGQVFKYTPSPAEGTAEEGSNPGQLSLFIEPNNTALLKSCDNLTIGPSGHLVLCEDRGNPRLIGVSPQGEIYHVGENVGYNSEFAGACFSADGRDLFVNIQGPGLTIAIRGPWGDVAPPA
ncbi:MAG: DUF839 domain-containing protein [Saprospiraceae bacterium]|nr:DUF839 domain-containing protein [Saprospiraceae bacterium]